jgi:hypothetical protein
MTCHPERSAMEQGDRARVEGPRECLRLDCFIRLSHEKPSENYYHQTLSLPPLSAPRGPAQAVVLLPSIQSAPGYP